MGSCKKKRAKKKRKVSKGCFGCMYNLGRYCKYFETLGKNKREIPDDIMDKGCKFYEKEDKIVKQIIEKFDGRFIG